MPDPTAEPTAAPRTPYLLTTGVLVIALAAVFVVGLRVSDDGTEAAAASLPPDTQSVGVVTSGEGSAEGRPDQLRFNATVTNQRETNEQALKATNHDVRAVTITLKKNGVEAQDIQTAGLTVEPRYDYTGRGQRIVGYTATQRVKVLVRNLDKAGETLGGVTTAAGNAVEIGGIQLTLSNKDEVIARARAAAVTKSKAAAEALARAAGREVGDLVYVEEVVPDRYGADYSFMESKSALDTVMLSAARARSVPISPGEQEFTVTVKVRWSLG